MSIHLLWLLSLVPKSNLDICGWCTCQGACVYIYDVVIEIPKLTFQYIEMYYIIYLLIFFR